jgi:hypothetical protein
MSLSVCLITRNEEKHLAQALASVAGLADQVVVADTGSTDGTVAVAARHGAEVSHVAWDDDFAAARNFALDRATSDWVLWLNPDEELPAASHPQVRACTARDDAFAYAVRVQELARPDRPDAFTETWQVRLFRRHTGLRYLGRLHPAFSPPVEEVAAREGKGVLPAELTIRRHAYFSTLSEAKLRWALRLLERELHDRPGRLPYLIEYGRTLLWLNDPKGHAVLAEAVEQLLPVRGAPNPPGPEVAPLLEYLLTVSPPQSRSRLTPEEAAELALRWFPATPPLLWRVAERAFRQKSFRQAAALLERLVQLGESGAYDRSLSFDASVVGDSALMNLGLCYLQLGELDGAESCFRRLLASPSRGADAAEKLRLVQDLRLRARPSE